MTTSFANTFTSTSWPARGVARVVVEQPRFDVRQHLWTGTVGLATLIGQAISGVADFNSQQVAEGLPTVSFLIGQAGMVIFLTFFILMAGDTFRRKLVRIAGPGLAQKKLTVQALEEINAQMQRYLLVQVVASVGAGLATWIAFALLGLKHAAVWGIASGVLNLVPYLGPAAITGGAALVAFLQFGGSAQMALLVGGLSLAFDTLKGYVFMPWATSRASRRRASRRPSRRSRRGCSGSRGSPSGSACRGSRRPRAGSP